MAIVRYSLEEIKKMPSLTDWERLRNMQDEDIDYSDNPAWTDEDFARATRNGKPLLETQKSDNAEKSLIAKRQRIPMATKKKKLVVND